MFLFLDKKFGLALKGASKAGCPLGYSDFRPPTPDWTHSPVFVYRPGVLCLSSATVTSGQTVNSAALQPRNRVILPPRIAYPIKNHGKCRTKIVTVYEGEGTKAG